MTSFILDLKNQHSFKQNLLLDITESKDFIFLMRTNITNTLPIYFNEIRFLMCYNIFFFENNNISQR